MRTRITIRLLISAAVTALFVSPTVNATAQAPLAQTTQQKQLPTQLSDSAFWSIISDFSEDEQPFTTYLVSNETFFPNRRTLWSRWERVVERTLSGTDRASLHRHSVPRSPLY
jgi:hypothetical protein